MIVYIGKNKIVWLRGGSCYRPQKDCRTYIRHVTKPLLQSYNFAFRIVKIT